MNQRIDKINQDFFFWKKKNSEVSDDKLNCLEVKK